MWIKIFSLREFLFPLAPVSDIELVWAGKECCLSLYSPEARRRSEGLQVWCLLGCSKIMASGVLIPEFSPCFHSWGMQHRDLCVVFWRRQCYQSGLWLPWCKPLSLWYVFHMFRCWGGMGRRGGSSLTSAVESLCFAIVGSMVGVLDFTLNLNSQETRVAWGL